MAMAEDADYNLDSKPKVQSESAQQVQLGVHPIAE